MDERPGGVPRQDASVLPEHSGSKTLSSAASVPLQAHDHHGPPGADVKADVDGPGFQGRRDLSDPRPTFETPTSFGHVPTSLPVTRATPDQAHHDPAPPSAETFTPWNPAEHWASGPAVREEPPRHDDAASSSRFSSTDNDRPSAVADAEHQVGPGHIGPSDRGESDHYWGMRPDLPAHGGKDPLPGDAVVADHDNVFHAPDRAVPHPASDPSAPLHPAATRGEAIGTPASHGVGSGRLEEVSPADRAIPGYRSADDLARGRNDGDHRDRESPVPGHDGSHGPGFPAAWERWERYPDASQPGFGHTGQPPQTTNDPRLETAGALDQAKVSDFQRDALGLAHQLRENDRRPASAGLPAGPPTPSSVDPTRHDSRPFDPSHPASGNVAPGLHAPNPFAPDQRASNAADPGHHATSYLAPGQSAAVPSAPGHHAASLFNPDQHAPANVVPDQHASGLSDPSQHSRVSSGSLGVPHQLPPPTTQVQPPPEHHAQPIGDKPPEHVPPG